MHVSFLCFIFVLYEIVLACVVFVLYAGCKKNKKTEKQKMMYCIFPRVEGDLVLLCCIFSTWNALWYFVLYFSRAWNALWYYCVVFFARGTRSGVIVLYFCAWNVLWRYCVIFSARGTRSVVIVLYFCAWNALWYVVLNSFRVVIYLPCDLPKFISKLP